MNLWNRCLTQCSAGFLSTARPDYAASPVLADEPDSRASRERAAAALTDVSHSPPTQPFLPSFCGECNARPTSTEPLNIPHREPGECDCRAFLHVLPSRRIEHRAPLSWRHDSSYTQYTLPPCPTTTTILPTFLARRRHALDSVRRGQADGQAHRPQVGEQDPRRRRRQAVHCLSEQEQLDVHRPAGGSRAGERLGRQYLLDQAGRHIGELLDSPVFTCASIC